MRTRSKGADLARILYWWWMARSFLWMAQLKLLGGQANLEFPVGNTEAEHDAVCDCVFINDARIARPDL